jgi:hypothetical protein
LSEWLVSIVIAVVGVIFAAGKIISSTRAEVRQLRADLNGLGGKVRRQHSHQQTIALLLIAMTEDRAERVRLVGLLKED